MKLVHSRTDPELFYMIRAPMEFWDLDKKLHWIQEWAPDQLVRPDTIVGTEPVKGLLAIDFQGFVVECRVELVPTDERDIMRFEDLGERGEELMRVFYRGILSGRMSSAEGVINSIDIPVERVSMEPSAEEARAGGGFSRLVRGTMTGIMYLLLAAIVFGSIGYTFWSRTNWVPIEAARLVTSQDAGAMIIRGQVPQDRLLQVHEGMSGLASVNVDGDVHRVPVQVEEIVAGELGIVSTLSIEPGSQLPGDVDPGTPVEVKLDRALLSIGPLQNLLSGGNGS